MFAGPSHFAAGSAADVFDASGLNVAVETQIAFSAAGSTLNINDSQFKNFQLQSSGSGTVVRIEAGDPDGNGSEFDGSTVFLLGGGAKLNFSPNSKSDQTVFNGSLNINDNGGGPNALWHFKNVSFAKRPTLHNVTTG